MLVVVTVVYLLLSGGENDWLALVLNILPVGLLSLAVLHSRRIHRIMVGCSSCTRTMILFIWMYMLEVFIPYLIVIACTFSGITPFSSIIVFLTLPVAIACAKTMKNSISGGATMIADMDERTANLQMMVSVLLVITFTLSRLYC